VILQRLVELYDRLATDSVAAEALPKPGYSLQKCSFCIVLNANGTLNQFQSLLETGKKKLIPRTLLVPGQSKPPGSGINPCFLWDNSGYMLGYKVDDTDPERSRKSFEAFRDRHLALESQINDPIYTAVCTFLKTWSPESAIEYAADLKDITGSFGVFKLAGETRFAHDDPEIVAFWAGHSAASSEEGEAESGLCLVTGVEGPIARLHEPKIKGVMDTQSAGALLVSFNDKAYESFGKEQGANAPVSATAAFKYTNALNYLLSRSDRRLTLGDTTVVFWAERPTMLENVASGLFGDWSPPADDAPAEDQERVKQTRLFLTELRDGLASDDAIDVESGIGFYVLGLSPNASRISVRLWVQTDVAEMRRRLHRHMSDMELLGAREGDEALMIRRIVLATGRAETDAKGHLKGYDADAVSPLLAGAVARAVFTGGPYPKTLLGAMLNRLRSDGVISHPRIAAIKACIVRNSRIEGNPKEVPVALDLSRTDPAYVTGRLFALLEKIQSDSAGGELSATIKDRYFSAASATPGVVFPRLIRLSQHHLAKMETGQKIYYERQMGEAVSKLDGFSHHLNLEDQGLFAIGYFHQRQALFTKKSKEEGDTE